MSLLPNTAIPTTWVKGVSKQTGSSGWEYKNHCYWKCGESQGVPPCMPTYFVNSKTSPYSKPELSIDSHANSGNDKITYTSTCPDYNLCPLIGNIAPQVQWDDSNSQCSMMEGPSAKLACLYPLATFQDEVNVDQYVRNFGETDEYNSKILPYFCSSQSESGVGDQKCPTNPATGQAMETCSQIVSNDRCRDWITNMQQSEDQDKIDLANNTLNSYCDTFNSPDCLCINRQLSPAYQIMRAGQICPDSCWWSPCQDTSQNRYLVPTEGIPACTCDVDQYCPQINVVIGGSSQNLSFNPTQYTSCSLSGNESPNQPVGQGDGTLWSNWWWLILLITAVIVAIIIIIVMLL